MTFAASGVMQGRNQGVTLPHFKPMKGASPFRVMGRRVNPVLFDLKKWKRRGAHTRLLGRKKKLAS